MVGYHRDETPWKELFDNRVDLGLQPVPLTPLLGQDRIFIGAIPVEVKNAAGDSLDARYQLALCASGMLQLRRDWASSQPNNIFDPENPPIVVALSIVGHVWSYYVIFLGKPPSGQTQSHVESGSIPRVVLGPFMGGHTMGIVPTFQLFHFLTVLREWVVNEWAPVVYEELGMPVAGS